MKVPPQTAGALTPLKPMPQAPAAANTGAPSTVVLAALDAVTSAGNATVTKDVDAAFRKGDYRKVIDLLDAAVGPLRGKDFSGMGAEALIGATASVYIFEERLKATLNKLSLTEAPADKMRALGLAKDVADISTAIFRRAVSMQDAADPHPVAAWVVAKDTHKKAKKWTPEDHLAYVAQKTVEWYLKGGDDSQVRQVDPSFLKDLKSGQLCEYVVDAYDVARAAVVEEGRPSPGHTVLAKGNDAFTAGTFEVQKNKKGEITQVLIGTFSGHYRTGLEAQIHLVRHVLAGLSQLYPSKSPAELTAMIVQREGQATNPRTLEVISRGVGIDGADAQRLENELRAQALRLSPAQATGGKSKLQGLAADAFALKDVVSGAIKDGVFTAKATPAQALAVLKKLDDLMELCVDFGTPAAMAVANQLIGTVRALQEYTDALPAKSTDAAVQKQIAHLTARWNNGVAGATGVDLGMVFAEPPVADRKTRLVATVNPKATDDQLRDMLMAGMDVARFNTAHGSAQEKIDVMKKLRSMAAQMGKDIQIQVDLEGPKIRLGKFENPKGLEKNDIFLKKGDTVTLTSKAVLGTPTLFPVDYPTMTKDAKPGDPLSMNDGTVQLQIVSVDDKAGTLQAKVTQGGKVWDNKGVAFPRSKLSGDTVTEEDLQNLTAMLPHVDLVAQSFVQSADDITFLRARMTDLGKVVPIIAKIERGNIAMNEAELMKIALASEALMVARGDLGVELGEKGLPLAERLIKDVGDKTGRPVMLATEVMMSVLSESRGSRGDVDALFGAVVERQFQAVMLGKETSAHKSPGDVIREVSGYLTFNEAQRDQPKKKAEPGLGATTAAALFVRRSAKTPTPHNDNPTPKTEG